MTNLISNFGAVLDFILASFTIIVNAILAVPLLTAMVALGMVVGLIYFVFSLLHT